MKHDIHVSVVTLWKLNSILRNAKGKTETSENPGIYEFICEIITFANYNLLQRPRNCIRYARHVRPVK